MADTHYNGTLFMWRQWRKVACFLGVFPDSGSAGFEKPSLFVYLHCVSKEACLYGDQGLNGGFGKANGLS